MILVLETDSRLREAISVNLEAEGFLVRGVADGVAARALLEDAGEVELPPRATRPCARAAASPSRGSGGNRSLSPRPRS